MVGAGRSRVGRRRRDGRAQSPYVARAVTDRLTPTSLCSQNSQICSKICWHPIKALDTRLRFATHLSEILVDLRFAQGRTYCCAEPSCHLPASHRKLIQLAAERSITIPETVIVHWHCHVEAGAKLESLAKLGLPLESQAYDIRFGW